MTPIEAAAIIDTMIQSINEKPSQFHFNLVVKNTGQKIVSNGGRGPVLQVSAVGGAAGSTTIGNQVSVSTPTTAKIEIARSEGNAEATAQMHAVLDTLLAISNQLKLPNPDRTMLSRLISGFKEWVPAVITSVVSQVVRGALGLPPA